MKYKLETLTFFLTDKFKLYKFVIAVWLKW